MKPVYFCHIPKTSGRFFTINTTLIIEQELLNRNIQYGNLLKAFGHRCFKPIDSENCLAYTFLRDPVARSISHWIHIYQNEPTGSIEDKKKFIDFLYENPTEQIINYQTKFISYNGDSEFIDLNPYSTEKIFSDYVTEEELNLAKTRLSKLDYIFDQKDQGYELHTKFVHILYNHFNLTPSLKNTIDPKYSHGNPESSVLYSSLDAKEIQEIQDIMKSDMELYTSTKFNIL